MTTDQKNTTSAPTASAPESAGRVANPWWVVVGAILGLIVGNGPIMVFTFGIFLKPITEEFGWTRSAGSSALVVGLTLTAVCLPMAGRLIDRFGIRSVVLPAIAIFAASMMALAFVPASATSFIIIYAVMGAAAAGQTPLPYAKAIAAWFDDKRGLALGIAMAGVGVGAGLVPQLAQYIVSTAGWRAAYIGLGLLTFALAFPAVLWLVRMPAKDSVAGAGSAAVQLGVSVGEAVRSLHFWILATAFFAVAAAANGTIAHVVPLLTDRGMKASIATSSLAFAGLALIGGRLLAGYLLDRMFAPFVAAFFFAIPLLGIALLMLAVDPGTTAVAVICIGLGLGAEVDLIAFLLSRYLGLRCFGEIYGYLFSVFMLGSAAGPFAMGLVYDRSGSYAACLQVFAIGLLFAIILITRLGPYRYPSNQGDAAVSRAGLRGESVVVD